MRLIARLGAMARQFRKWIYYLGNEFTTITGGWSGRNWTGNSAIWNSATPGVTKNAAYMNCAMPDTYSSGKSGVIQIANLIDMTPYSKLRIKISGHLHNIYNPASNRYQRVYLFCSDVTSGNWTSGSVYDALALLIEHTASAALNFTDSVYELNIETLNGYYRPYIGLVWSHQAGASWIDVTEVEFVP